MTAIWKEGGFVENDPWVVETEDRKAGEGERALIPYADIIENGVEGNEPVGVVLGPFDDPTRLAPYLDRITLVALTFPAFSDGRAFSQATLLRERLVPPHLKGPWELLVRFVWNVVLAAGLARWR